MFVEDFNRLLVKKETAFDVKYKVEGRCSSLAPDLLKLQNCPLLFRPAKGEEFGKSPGKRQVVELIGELEKQNGKTVFIVERLRFLPDDLATYRLKKEGVRGGKPEDWYHLARWAGRRAEFYEDEALRAAVLEANRTGVELERKNLPERTAAALLSLAEKAKKLQLSENVRLEFVHEAYRVEWDRLRDVKRPDMAKLLEQMAARLPGCKDRLPTPQPELEKKYRADPLVAYRLADPAARRKMHRIFYSDVAVAAILQTAKADGSNGLEVGEDIDEAVPERHALAEQYRNLWLDYRFGRIEALTRTEMLDLADRLRRRQNPNKAQEAVVKWLKATEASLRREGGVGLMRAAEEYVDLLEDDETAVRLLREAFALGGETERIAEKLTRLGYRLHDGEWIPQARVESLPEDPVQKAIREGRVIAGMTAGQVQSALGAPTSVTRIATTGQLNELWSYGRRSNTRLTVHLRRRTPRSELKAVRISQIAPR